jgi:pimeloyl-ACP methyl ester carboxylesterase
VSVYVLVHGAWHSGLAWSRLAPALGARGHRVYAPDLTGHGEKRHLSSPEVTLSTHVDDVVRLLTAEDLDDVVLVGHSYAGMVISGVVERVPERIARLVFLDAMVPADGKSALDVVPATRLLIDQAAATENPWRIPPLPAGETGWFGVRDPGDLAWLRTFVDDEPIGCFTERLAMREPRARRIPRTYIECTADKPAGTARTLPPLQPNGSPTVVLSLDAGHDCMITAPDQLAVLLVQASA